MTETLQYFNSQQAYNTFLSRIRTARPTAPAPDLASALVSGRNRLDTETVIEDTVVNLSGAGSITLTNGTEVGRPLAPETIIRYSDSPRSHPTDTHDDTLAYHLLAADLAEHDS